MIKRALIVRDPYATLLLKGEKTWEMRSKPTTFTNERIGIIIAKTGMIFGEITLVQYLHAIDLERLWNSRHLHRIPDDKIEEAYINRWTTPWVMKDPLVYSMPRPYKHPQGAVTWVNLN